MAERLLSGFSFGRFKQSELRGAKSHREIDLHVNCRENHFSSVGGIQKRMYGKIN
jgi:hypothetical protein